MAIEYWYPNGNDGGGWGDPDHTKADEGLNPGPGIDNNSSGPDDADYMEVNSEANTLTLDTGPAGGSSAIGDADTVTQVRIFVRARSTSGSGSDEIEVGLLIGGVLQGTVQSTGVMTGSFATYTFSDAIFWNSDWTAAQLAGMQVALESRQSGMPSAYNAQVSEVEVEVTYTAATPAGPEPSAYIPPIQLVTRVKGW